VQKHTGCPTWGTELFTCPGCDETACVVPGASGSLSLPENKNLVRRPHDYFKDWLLCTVYPQMHCEHDCMTTNEQL